MKKRKRIISLSILGLSIGLSIFFSSVFPDMVAGQTTSNPIGPNGKLGSFNPTDTVLERQRDTEFASRLEVAVPPAGTVYTPAQRSPRDTWGEVGVSPLELASLDRLVYPDIPINDRQLLVEGAQFFTLPETAAAGVGPMSNFPNCLGCHLNSDENITSNPPLLRGLSLVSRASRATPTNFQFVQGNSTTGGRAPDNLDAVTNTGSSKSFTIFGDFSPAMDATRTPGQLAASLQQSTPVADPAFDPLTPFGGFIQQARPSLPGCLPDRIPSVTEDTRLGSINPDTGLSPSGFRRSVADRAGPPYVGRGLMEAVPNQDILNFADPTDGRVLMSSLNQPAVFVCQGDCVTGHVNFTPLPPINQPRRFLGSNDPNNLLVGRFGLRANGAEIFQFTVGGFTGTLSLTQLININDNPVGDINLGRPGCIEGVPSANDPNGLRANDPEANLSLAFSTRNFIRATAPPEFGKKLLTVLNASDNQITNGFPAITPVGKVKRGAQLFGVDLVAFANRTINGRMPSGGDGRNLNAINTSDVMVGCVSCHIPIVRTGDTPASRYTTTNDTASGPDANNPSITSRTLTAAERASIPRSEHDLFTQHLSFKYAAVFSDMILHQIPSIQAERVAFIPRTPWRVQRPDRFRGRVTEFNSFDIPRNLADDVFTNEKGATYGDEFRTPPLMGLGRIGAPLLHDARVYLSSLTQNTSPASTVFSNSDVTNAPLVVRTFDDAIRAAIELHDLPAPDDAKTPSNGGCPVPPVNSTNVTYGVDPASVICPPYNSPLSRNDNRLAAGPNRTGRSEAKEVMRRYRALSPGDQQALIDFLEEL